MSGRRVAFVVGCPRSGTTLVQQLLNAHSRVRIGPETHFVHRFWQPRARYGDLETDAGWDRLVRDVAAMPELADIGLDPEQVTARAATVERHPGGLLAALLDLFGGDALVTGEKTPSHLLYMPLLQEWIPDARFIHVLRDPRAVAASWRTVPWSSGTVYGDTAIWRRYVRTARRNPPRPGSLLELRYERLVADAENELRRMCAFLGLDYEAGMLEHHRHGPVGVDPEREPWKRRVQEPVSADRVSEWNRELSPWQQLQVEATAGRALERSGYRPVTPRLSRAALGPLLRGVAAIRRFSARSRDGGER